jgi:hypothetical protein
MSELHVRVFQNGCARGWYWEVTTTGETLIECGLAATPSAAKEQADAYIELMKKVQFPPWKHAG